MLLGTSLQIAKQQIRILFVSLDPDPSNGFTGLYTESRDNAEPFLIIKPDPPKDTAAATVMTNLIVKINFLEVFKSLFQGVRSF